MSHTRSKPAKGHKHICSRNDTMVNDSPTPMIESEFAHLLSELFPSEHSRKRAAFMALRGPPHERRQSPPPKRTKTDKEINEEGGEGREERKQDEKCKTEEGGEEDCMESGQEEDEEAEEEQEDKEDGGDDDLTQSCSCDGGWSSTPESGSEHEDEVTGGQEHRITLVVKAESSDYASDSSGDSSETPNYVRQFRRLIRGKNNSDDVEYFRENLTAAEQANVVSDLGRIARLSSPDKPYCLQLLETQIPDNYKAIAYRKMTALRELEPGSGEHHKLKQWINTLMRVPFGKYKDLPVSLEKNTLDECSAFLSTARQTMDSAVYGMTDVKEQIYQLLGQWVANPSAIGTAIAIEGPMGTGKTTLVREGISKALGRDFIFMALGGATDSSFLEGHSYTYEGATHGRIVEGLAGCTSMNPIFFFDELDKVSDTPRGQEIIGILTHLTDSSQNTEFHDKYFAELSFDLSRALFVFSYNDASMINPILRDRMHKLCTRGYTPLEKISISRGYLLPAVRARVRFNESLIVIPDDVIKHVVEKYTQKEKGVRNLGRCLSIIHTKVNLARLVKDTKEFMKSDIFKGISVPFTLSKVQADALLGTKGEVESWRHMYM